MAKASFNKTYKISAKGTLNVEDDVVSIENPDTGELIQLSNLFADFSDRQVSITINYEEEYLSE